jgi:hypothetical protein
MSGNGKREIETGRRLATVDGMDYVQVAGVFRVAPDGEHTFYCALEGWHSSEAAKLAARDQRIAELEQEVARLRSPDRKPITRQPGEKKPSDTPPLVPCPECGKPFVQGSAMALHRMRAHGLRGKGLGYVNGKHSRETETQEQGGDDAEDE